MLELAIAHTLYERFPDFEEGQMAKLRSHVVSRASCAIVARELGLGERLLAACGRPRDRGADAARRRTATCSPRCSRRRSRRSTSSTASSRSPAAIVEAFESRIEFALTTRSTTRPSCRRRSRARPQSLVLRCSTREGPPHERTFTRAAVVDGEQVGSADGQSKKEAEQERRSEALAGCEPDGQDSRLAGVSRTGVAVRAPA